MEVTTDLSQKIIDIVHNIVSFFTNQELSSYSLILILVALITFTIVYVFNSIALMKKCYWDIDHNGFVKINLLNLFSILLCSQINPESSIVLNIFFSIFFIPVLAWFVFMLKLFILNIKRYKNKKNFVKNKKMQADVGKQIGVGHRISKNDLNGVYKTANEVYDDCQPDVPLEGQEVNRHRINNDAFERKE